MILAPRELQELQTLFQFGGVPPLQNDARLRHKFQGLPPLVPRVFSNFAVPPLPKTAPAALHVGSIFLPFFHVRPLAPGHLEARHREVRLREAPQKVARQRLVGIEDEAGVPY